MKHFLRKVGTLSLASAVALTSLEGGIVARAAQEKIIVTPFENQWKYYGQTRVFREDENYSLSEAVDSSHIHWTLGIEDESVGVHPFVLNVAEEDSEYSFALADNAPTFEVKEWKTDAQVEYYKTSDAEATHEQDLSVYATSKDSVFLQAPDGYLISGKADASSDSWGEELETGSLQEGENKISYYLRSNLQDSTRKAIDQQEKTAVVRVDSIPPQIKDLTVGESFDVSSEAGISIVGEDAATYYYIVVPADYSEEVTADIIREKVASGMCIGGFGRVDSSQEAPLNIRGLTAKTEYKICAFLEDDAGNVSDVKESGIFSTEKMALEGEVEVTGEPELDSTLTAVPKLTSNGPGAVSYQWYRVKLSEDAEEFNADFDETGGAEEDDLEADVSEDEEDSDEEDSEDEEDSDEEDSEDEEIEDWSASRKREAAVENDDDAEEVTSLDGAELIEGATSESYKVTKQDIGYHLIAAVTAENFSGYVAGSTAAFVPKLMPTYNVPTVASAVYSPVRKLSKIKLPAQWSWVDNTIVPVYGNSGYRARFVPADTSIYKSVVIRVKVPVTKKALSKSLITVHKKMAYTGKAIKNAFVIKYQKKKLQVKKDYKVEYINNKKLGKAIAKITGVGNYKGRGKITFLITRRSLKSKPVKCYFEDVKVYRGKPIAAALTLKNGTVGMKKNRDYTVTYKNNVEVGEAKIVLKGKGNYKGQRTLKFSIVPKRPSIKKVKRTGRKLRLTLSAGKDITGYRVFMSSSRSFKKSKTQQYIVTGNGFGIQKMSKGTWYMRVKVYKIRKGKTYISSYSKVKKVKIK